jgi:hypothetical protein
LKKISKFYKRVHVKDIGTGLLSFIYEKDILNLRYVNSEDEFVWEDGGLIYIRKVTNTHSGIKIEILVSNKSQNIRTFYDECFE